MKSINNRFLSFGLHYTFWLLIFHFLITFDYSPLYKIELIQTQVLIEITKQFINIINLNIHIIDNRVVFDNGLELLILNECNGIAIYIFTVSAIMASDRVFLIKLLWIVISYLTLMVTNILRVEFVIYYVNFHPDRFEFIHNFIGRLFLSFVSVVLFYLFIKSRNLSLDSK